MAADPNETQRLRMMISQFRVSEKNLVRDQCQQSPPHGQFLLIQIRQNTVLLALKRAHQTSLLGQSELQISHSFKVIEHQVQIDSNHLIKLEILLQYSENLQVMI